MLVNAYIKPNYFITVLARNLKKNKGNDAKNLNVDCSWFKFSAVKPKMWVKCNARMCTDNSNNKVSK